MRPSLRDALGLTAIRGVIKAKKFADAVAEPDKTVAFGTDHADIYNLRGLAAGNQAISGKPHSVTSGH